jgi:rare lipoprotein A
MGRYKITSRTGLTKYRSNATNYSNNVNDNDKSEHKDNSGILYDKCNGGYYKIGAPYKINGKKYYPKEYDKYKEKGLASWYGDDFHNKKTANNEVFNMNDMVAAHRTLPLPSIVRVTNLKNGQSALIRVNDRGPFSDEKNRIIDLSKEAAKRLDFKNNGLTEVIVELLPNETKQYRKKCGLAQ